jgi:hypothetical protein
VRSAFPLPLRVFISCINWVALLTNALLSPLYIRQLEPGGYLEIQDSLFPIRCDDDTMPEGTPVLRWTRLLVEAAEKLGRPLAVAASFKGMLEAAGFEDVVEERYKWPSNTWPRHRNFKDLGMWTFACLDGGLEGLSLALFTYGLGWTKEETLVLCSQVRNDLRNTRIHAYFEV